MAPQGKGSGGRWSYLLLGNFTLFYNSLGFGAKSLLTPWLKLDLTWYWPLPCLASCWRLCWYCCATSPADWLVHCPWVDLADFKGHQLCPLHQGDWVIATGLILNFLYMHDFCSFFYIIGLVHTCSYHNIYPEGLWHRSWSEQAFGVIDLVIIFLQALWNFIIVGKKRCPKCMYANWHWTGRGLLRNTTN